MEMVRTALSIDVSDATLIMGGSGSPSALPTSACGSAMTSRGGAPHGSPALSSSSPWSAWPTSDPAAGSRQCIGPSAAAPEVLKKHKWKAEEDAALQRLVTNLLAAQGSKVRWSVVGALA